MVDGPDAVPLFEEWRKLDAQLRYYMHVDPDVLTDEEWAMRVNELRWLREEEAKQFK